MSIIWRKVLRDLWGGKLRTLLVVLSTAVGVFSLGLAFGALNLVQEQMTESHILSNAPHIEMWTAGLDEMLLQGIRRVPDVVDVQGEQRVSIHWKFAGEEAWRDGEIIARHDYATQSMYPITLLTGAWPGKRTLAVERMSAAHFDIPVGSTIIVQVGRREREIQITGSARHPYTPPPQIGIGEATFCATSEMLAWLTDQPERFNALYVRIMTFSEEAAQAAVEQVSARLKRAGVEVYGHSFVQPDRHWAQDMIDTVLLILVVLGGLSLALSGFLIVNTMNAIVVQQVWQIGVMKVVGATTGRVVSLYLTTAFIYSLLSLGLAIPLGALGAYLLSAWMLDLFNITVGPFRFLPLPLLLQMGVGLLVPLGAACVPVLGGARVSPHQAISSRGLGGKFGRGWFDRLIGHIRSLPRPAALSLRNTFRRKARVTLTLLALTLGGVMFLVVMSVGSSLRNTIDVLLQDFGFDVLVTFEQPYHIARIANVAEQVPGVAGIEVWDIRGAQLQKKNGEELSGQLWGIPDDSQLFNPRIVTGRGLLPGDGQAILLNHKIALDEGIVVGDVVTLTVGRKEMQWTVVGTLTNINNNQRDNFVPYNALARALGNSYYTNQAMIITTQHDTATHVRVREALRAAYTANDLRTARFETAGEIREQNVSQFNVIVYLMLAMAVLAAVVGGMGLMGTMSINVVERGREIGVMRSIGAASPAIVGIFVLEGMFVGALSWLLAVPLSYPGAQIFSAAIGQGLMSLPLDFMYPVSSLLLWLAIVLVISALSSLWPALRATRVSVRESLAYE